METVDVLRSALNVRKRSYRIIRKPESSLFLLASSVVQSSLVCQVFNFRNRPSDRAVSKGAVVNICFFSFGLLLPPSAAHKSVAS